MGTKLCLQGKGEGKKFFKLEGGARCVTVISRKQNPIEKKKADIVIK